MIPQPCFPDFFAGKIMETDRVQKFLCKNSSEIGNATQN
jgi:hypothetical protein